MEAQIDATINGTPVPGGGRRGGRLANLDKIDEHSDNENIKNMLSHCQRVTRNCAAVQPLYYLRQVRPSLTRRAAVAADVRIASTLEHIAHAGASPQERRGRALRQQKLPVCMGGGGITNNTGVAAAAWAASVLRSLPDMRRCSPLIAGIDVDASDLTFFTELHDVYADLHEKRDEAAARHDGMEEPHNKYIEFDGNVKLKFKPRGLVPAKKLKDNVSAYTVCPDDDSYATPPSQKELSGIVHHTAWLALYDELAAHDTARGTAAAHRHREASSCSSFLPLLALGGVVVLLLLVLILLCTFP